MTAGRPRKFVEPVISLRLRLPKSLHEKLKNEVEGTGRSLNDHIIGRLSDGDGGSFVTVGAVPPSPVPPRQAQRVIPRMSFEACDGYDARHPLNQMVEGTKTCTRCGAVVIAGRMGWYPPE